MIATPGAILTLGLGGSPSLLVTLGYGIGAYVPPVVQTKIGGDDRIEVWEKRKPAKKKDAELQNAVQAAFDKAMGRVKPEVKVTPVLRAIEQIAPVMPSVLMVIEDNESDDEEALMLLLAL